MGAGRDTVGILARLVQFNTTSAPSNLALSKNGRHVLAAVCVAGNARRGSAVGMAA